MVWDRLDEVHVVAEYVSDGIAQEVLEYGQLLKSVDEVEQGQRSCLEIQSVSRRHLNQVGCQLHG